MKRFIILPIVASALLCINGNLAAQDMKTAGQEPTKQELKEQKKQQKKARKEMKKKIDSIGETVAFEKASRLIQEGTFVIEADQIQSRRGGITPVAANTNFISMNNGESVIQIAPSNHIAGPNGVGGITVDGKVSDISISHSKNGNLNYSYNVQGIGVSAVVKITLPKGSTTATATIYPNFNNNEITLTGRVVSPQNSKVFKGRAL